MAGRKVADVDEARALLDEHQESGMSLASIARKNGIDGRSLNAWRMNLERARSFDDMLPEFVELVPAVSRPAPAFQVRCGAFAVEVPPRFDAQGLARLLAVVASC